MLLLEISHIQELIKKVGLKNFYLQLAAKLTEDFSHWDEFHKSSRHAIYVENGVLELMPVADRKRYAFKYVNGHPNNPKQNKLNVVAVGMLINVDNGYPLMVNEMTLLTALRTAAITAVSSRYFAKKDSKKLAIIGCGAQSEFLVLAHHALFDLQEVYYYDLDPKAMERFAHNLRQESFKLIAATDAKSAIENVDIIVTATAAKGKVNVIENSWLKPGQHICGVGGDSEEKSELDPEILKHTKIVVEYLPQTSHEGEIKLFGEKAKDHVYAELWEVVTGKKKGRENDTEITLYDSVGFALEDYSIMNLVYDLATQYHIGKEADLIPEHLEDCKDLYGLLIK